MHNTVAVIIQFDAIDDFVRGRISEQSAIEATVPRAVKI